MLDQLLFVCVAALVIVGFYRYTVGIHRAWAEEEAERVGLDAESRGIGTIARGTYRGVHVWLALSGRRVTEGEAKLVDAAEPPTVEEFRDAKALFGGTHFKRDAVWAEFPRSKPNDPIERYADALVVVATFAARRSPEELYRLDHVEEE